MWDETLADSSLLNKASCKLGGGGGKEGTTKREDPIGSSQKYKSQSESP
jgi:hypothetical protein